MRLDKYLKVSRLIKRRSVASDACLKGKIRVNGILRKPAYVVKIGDTIEIALGKKQIKIRVVSVDEACRKEGAHELYSFLSAQSKSLQEIT